MLKIISMKKKIDQSSLKVAPQLASCCNDRSNRPLSAPPPRRIRGKGEGGGGRKEPSIMPSRGSPVTTQQSEQTARRVAVVVPSKCRDTIRRDPSFQPSNFFVFSVFFRALRGVPQSTGDWQQAEWSGGQILHASR